MRVESRTEHTFTREVVVTAVLEDGARNDLTEPLAREPEPRHETIERGRQHVLIGRVSVWPIGACERDPVAAQHAHPAHLHLAPPDAGQLLDL